MAESLELESQILERQSADEKIQHAEIIWSGDCSVCCKKLKHYPAFSTNGTTVTVHSFAIIMGEEAEEENEPIGYLEDLYEDYRRRKMVKVRWFNRSEEMISSGLMIPEHELIMTPDVQVVSAECVNGIVTVLSPKHYEQSLSILSQDFSDGIFMCSRQIKKNNNIVSFPLSKLRGYSNQTIFSILNPPNLLNQQVLCDKQEKKEEDVQACVTTVCLVEEEPSQEILKLKASVCSEVHCFGVGHEIEVLCEDSGIRGCWYRCEILKATKKRLKVLYKDVEDAGGPGNIMEWVDRYKVAAPDKLGMRCLGRYTIRPFPTSSPDDCYSIGSVVDAWWCDGWWEGIVVNINVCGDGTFRVYFPGENRNENFVKEQLRSSKDWVDNEWVQVDPKPDLLILVSLRLESSSSSNVKSALGGSGGDIGSSETKEAEKGGTRTGCN